MQRIVRLLIFLLLPLPLCAQGDVVASQYKILTDPNGWAVLSKYSIAEGTLMKDMLAGLTPCHRSDQLTFKADGTYERVYYKTDCANASLKNTKGSWKYDADPAIAEGIVALHMKDQVDPGLSADYLVVTVADAFGGGLVLAPLPDQNASEKTVLIYSPYKSAAQQQSTETPAQSPAKATTTSQKATPAKATTTNPLLLGLISLNDDVLGKAGKNLDDVFETNLINEEFRIVAYNNKETGTGPYYLINYKGNKNEEYLCDIQTDYTGSRLTIYRFTANAWKETTEDLLGKDFESQNITQAFDKWLEYTQASVTINKSEQNYIYSLGPDNFLTLNPSIMVELNVTWVDSQKQEQADARVVAKIKFDGQNFVWTWQE